MGAESAGSRAGRQDATQGLSQVDGSPARGTGVPRRRLSGQPGSGRELCAPQVLGTGGRASQAVLGPVAATFSKAPKSVTTLHLHGHPHPPNRPLGPPLLLCKPLQRPELCRAQPCDALPFLG